MAYVASGAKIENWEGDDSPAGDELDEGGCGKVWEGVGWRGGVW